METIEEHVYAGLVLNKERKWCTLSKAVDKESEYMYHLEKGDIVYNGEWVNIDVVLAEMEGRTEEPEEVIHPLPNGGRGAVMFPDQMTPSDDSEFSIKQSTQLMMPLPRDGKRKVTDSTVFDSVEIFANHDVSGTDELAVKEPFIFEHSPHYNLSPHEEEKKIHDIALDIHENGSDHGVDDGLFDIDEFFRDNFPDDGNLSNGKSN